ncbi:unnamed protein product, partial [Notodromas monacha]
MSLRARPHLLGTILRSTTPIGSGSACAAFRQRFIGPLGNPADIRGTGPTRVLQGRQMIIQMTPAIETHVFPVVEFESRAFMVASGTWRPLAEVSRTISSIIGAAKDMTTLAAAYPTDYTQSDQKALVAASPPELLKSRSSSPRTGTTSTDINSNARSTKDLNTAAATADDDSQSQDSGSLLQANSDGVTVLMYACQQDRESDVRALL